MTRDGAVEAARHKASLSVGTQARGRRHFPQPATCPGGSLRPAWATKHPLEGIIKIIIEATGKSNKEKKNILKKLFRKY